ncbi:MAG: TIGR03668 family PPOX class F420-dependent oxidoreductase [Haloarculaceae archaeon]
MTMVTDPERSFLESARVGRLATADAEANPHAVPVCYALVGGRLVSAIDEKPKSTTDLQRVRDVAENPRVALVVDHYEEDWSELAWVQARGRAAVLDPDDSGHADAVAALREKYDQYRDHGLESRPVVEIRTDRVLSWGL